jgi:heterodisulfide reductase subunit A-like polyferredoxin
LGKLPLALTQDDYGFIVDGEGKGIFAAGVARHPVDVARSVKEGTAAALKAIQFIRQSYGGTSCDGRQAWRIYLYGLRNRRRAGH